MQVESRLDFSSLIAEKTQGFVSRDWVYQAIDRWLEDPEGSRFFLITGEPGSGKTAVIARLAEMCDAQTIEKRYRNLGAGTPSYFHFCRADHSASLNPQIFL